MKHHSPILPILLLALVASLLSGCAAVVVGGATGATIAHDRRTTGTFIEDQDILIKAMRIRSGDDDLQKRSNINIEVYNLKILLTGQAESREVVQRFVQQLQSIPRVTKIYDEVQIGAEGTWSDATADAYLTSRVKVALFDVGIEGFDPLRVKVTSSQGTVYLMGLLTQSEAQAVTDKVRYVSGVKRVVRLFDYY
jgi:osmotically-inducible protein OsmY